MTLLGARRGLRGGFGGGATLRVLFLARARLFLLAALLFGLLLARGFVFDTAAVLRLHALAFLARGFLALALGGFRRFHAPCVELGLVLVLLVLLF